MIINDLRRDEMKDTKTIAFVAAGLLVLSGLSFLPSVAGQGREKSLEQRVTILEAQLAELTEQVDELKGGSCSCTTLNLQPLAELPIDPSEGDLCVVWSEYLPGEFGNIPYCYVHSEWHALIYHAQENPNPRQ